MSVDCTKKTVPCHLPNCPDAGIPYDLRAGALADQVIDLQRELIEARATITALEATIRVQRETIARFNRASQFIEMLRREQN
jgi:hypothetical protein